MTQQVVGAGAGQDSRQSERESERKLERAPESEIDPQFLRTEFLERVAHELRGPIGVTMGALDELEMALASLSGRSGGSAGPASSSTGMAGMAGMAGTVGAPNGAGGNAEAAAYGASGTMTGLAEAAPRIAALLAMARRGTRKVLRTADRLSRAAQLETGTVVVSTHAVDLRGIVARATQDAATTEGRASVEVVTDLSDEPCMVDVDADWMGAALTELVGHAIRAGKRSVRVSVANDDRRPGRVVVAVADDRITALEPVRPRFSRNSPRRDIGLDMPLVHDVARLHGAEIEVEQRVAADGSTRAGVTMTVSVPLAPR